MSEWAGDNPYFLMIEEPSPSNERQFTQIDLDEKGWLTTHQRLMRAVGTWYLCRKPEGNIVAMMRVHEGEQPYYVAKHVGTAKMGANLEEGAAAESVETISYGIGKKRLDGHVDRLWIMANGCATLGDDVESISMELLRAGFV